MRKTIFSALLVFLFLPLKAEQKEITMLNITAPSGLEANQAYFNIGHKYYYDLKKYKTPDEDIFAPITYGANINLGFRYMIWEGIEAGIYYNGIYQEKRASLSWNKILEDALIRVSAYAEYFNYRDPLVREYWQNMFFLVSAQSEYLIDMISLAVNAGYDGYNGKFVAGAGISVKFLGRYSVIAEWYPVFKAGTGGYCFGVKAVTYGHQFIFFAGNTPAQGARNALGSGTSPETLHLGFNIQRLIEF